MNNFVLLKFHYDPAEGPAEQVWQNKVLAYLNRSQLNQTLVEKNTDLVPQGWGISGSTLWGFCHALQKAPTLTSHHILYEDEECIAINKPTGLPVHQTNRPLRANVYDSVRKILFERSQKELPYLGLPHRLDRDTSGVLLLAKTPAFNTQLARQFAKRRIKKLYLAASDCQKPCLFTNVEIKNQLLRYKDPALGFRTIQVQHGGQEAHSTVLFLGQSQNLSHFAVIPHTGRTHQIRVHLAELGYSLFGDGLYNTPSAQGPLHLHAYELKFYHAKSKKVVKITAPPPLYLQKNIELLSQLDFATYS